MEGKTPIQAWIDTALYRKLKRKIVIKKTTIRAVIETAIRIYVAKSK